MKHWSVLKTMPKCESIVEKRIRSKLGNYCETFVPTGLVMISHSRRVNWEPRPLFSTYMFVCMDYDESDDIYQIAFDILSEDLKIGDHVTTNNRVVKQSWQDLQRLPGAIGFIKAGLKPAILDTEIVKAIQSAQNLGVFDERKPRPYAISERVKVTDGPFAGLIARIASLDHRSRQHVILELLDFSGPINGARVTCGIDKIRRIA